jgi:putative hydrolase of HD superfamily
MYPYQPVMNTNLQFTHLAPYVWESLRTLPRTGWVKRKIENPETVAEHTCALIDLAIELLDLFPEFSSSDKQRILEMLEIHDWPEYHPELGDIPSPELGTNGYMTKEEKVLFENKIMQQIADGLGHDGAVILSLWRELVEQKTLASQFVHQLDKLQPILLAIKYEERGECPGMAQDFYDFLGKQVVHPVLVQFLLASVRATDTISG